MKLFIEIANEKRSEDGSCGDADIRPATQEEIDKFMKEPCNHRNTELLVYDTPAFMYDIRSCAVCHSVIGMI
jgi:hypothetical protein